jgi:integrase
VAKVPKVSAHGMRGLHGTLAAETGLSAHAVAAALGHEKVTTTLQSYAKSGAGARQKRVLDVLKGGRMPPECKTFALQTFCRRGATRKS